MQPVRRLVPRRLAAVAVLTLGGGLSLAGCRTDPSVAAYVGPDEITEAQVDRLVDDVEATAVKPAGGQPPAAKPNRADVLTTLLLGKVCAAIQAKQGFAAADVNVEEVARLRGVAPTSEYAKEDAKTRSCLGGVRFDGAGTTPTDAELKDVYDRANAKGMVNVPFEQIKSRLAGDTDVRQAIAAKRVVTQMIADGDVSVNPRYRPLELPLSDLGSGVPLVVAELGEPGSDAVRNTG